MWWASSLPRFRWTCPFSIVWNGIFDLIQDSYGRQLEWNNERHITRRVWWQRRVFTKLLCFTLFRATFFRSFCPYGPICPGKCCCCSFDETSGRIPQTGKVLCPFLSIFLLNFSFYAMNYYYLYHFLMSFIFCLLTLHSTSLLY